MYRPSVPRDHNESGHSPRFSQRNAQPSHHHVPPVHNTPTTSPLPLHKFVHLNRTTDSQLLPYIIFGRAAGIQGAGGATGATLDRVLPARPHVLVRLAGALSKDFARLGQQLCDCGPLAARTPRTPARSERSPCCRGRERPEDPALGSSTAGRDEGARGGEGTQSQGTQDTQDYVHIHFS